MTIVTNRSARIFESLVGTDDALFLDPAMAGNTRGVMGGVPSPDAHSTNHEPSTDTNSSSDQDIGDARAPNSATAESTDGARGSTQQVEDNGHEDKGGAGAKRSSGDVPGGEQNELGGSREALGDGRELGHASDFAGDVASTILHRRGAIRSGGPPNNLPGSLDRLSAYLFARATRYWLAAGEALFHAGEEGDGCYRLDKGVLKVSMTSPQGEERIIALIGPGSIVGEMAIIDGRPRSASVIAVRDCELSFISRVAFKEYTQQHPEVYEYLVNVLAARLRETNEAMAATTFLTIKARVARTLLELAKYLGQEAGPGRILIRYKINQGDLAAMTGVARENVSRILNKWKRQNIVTRWSFYYTINKIATLERELQS